MLPPRAPPAPARAAARGLPTTPPVASAPVLPRLLACRPPTPTPGAPGVVGVRLSFVLPARVPALAVPAGSTTPAGTPPPTPAGAVVVGGVVVVPGVSVGGIVGAAAEATWVGVAPAAIALSPSGLTRPNWPTTSAGVRACARSPYPLATSASRTPPGNGECANTGACGEDTSSGA